MVADLDGDGTPEVIGSEHVLDGKTGADKTPTGLALNPFFAQVADFNLDGRPDLLLVESRKQGQAVRVYEAHKLSHLFVALRTTRRPRISYSPLKTRATACASRIT